MDEPMAVSQLLRDESDKVAHFLALVGEHTLSLSVVGQPPLRDVSMSIYGAWIARVCSEYVLTFTSLLLTIRVRRGMIISVTLMQVWILRFLIGFKWNTKIAAEKFTRMVEWRVKFGKSCSDHNF